LVEVRGAGDAEDAGGVELGVDVVELFAGVGGGEEEGTTGEFWHGLAPYFRRA
jgi:hypothetical protein